MKLPKLDSFNLLEKTYFVLKDRIVRREFSPNQKLSIPDLSTQLGVSRTPIRDALNRLEMDGLVTTIAKVGTFVNAIKNEDVLDIIDTRLMLELWVLDKLPSLPKKEVLKKIARLDEVVKEATYSIENSSLDDFFKFDYNLKFHIEYINLGNNKRIADIYLGIMNYHFLTVKHALITKQMVTSAVHQHASIVTALKKEQFSEAQTLIRVHLDDSKERLLKRLQDNGGQL